MSGYFKNIAEGVKTTLTGMKLTLRHAFDARKRRKANNIQLGDFFDLQTGMVTVQYPKETVAIPDNGRYRLHNEMDDCIVCDKCAKVCPVDCIDIEPIKATEEVGRASDGSVIRLYAARFDIDMAKCCYCGLCTTVCPTECLTMTKTFDYSEFDVREMVYAYSNLSPEEAQKKRELLEQFQLEKAQGKTKPQPARQEPAPAKPAFKPVMKPRTATSVPASHPVTPAPKKTSVKFHPKNWSADLTPGFTPLSFSFNANPVKRRSTEEGAANKPLAAKGTGFRPTMKPKAGDNSGEMQGASKPAFRPTMKPKTEASQASDNKAEAAKPAFRPTMKPKAETAKPVEETTNETPKPAFRPTIKPKTEVSQASENKTEAVKPAFRPTMKPKVETAKSVEETTNEAPKPAFRPTMKPKTEVSQASENKTEAAKPTFRPTMKPKVEPAKPVEETTNEAPKPAFRPTMKPKTEVSQASENKTEAAKPVFRPTMKPKAETAKPLEETNEAPKPAFRPTIKPKAEVKTPSLPSSDTASPKEETGKTSFHPSKAPTPVNPPTDSLPGFIAPNLTSLKGEGNKNVKFHPSDYRKPDTKELRPVFGKAVPPMETLPNEVNPIQKAEHSDADQDIKAASPSASEANKRVFRPTMKPKK